MEKGNRNKYKLCFTNQLLLILMKLEIIDGLL